MTTILISVKNPAADVVEFVEMSGKDITAAGVAAMLRESLRSEEDYQFCEECDAHIAPDSWDVDSDCCESCAELMREVRRSAVEAKIARRYK